MPLGSSIGNFVLSSGKDFYAFVVVCNDFLPPCLFLHLSVEETAYQQFCPKNNSSGGYCQPFLGFYLWVRSCEVQLKINVLNEKYQKKMKNEYFPGSWWPKGGGGEQCITMLLLCLQSITFLTPHDHLNLGIHLQNCIL